MVTDSQFDQLNKRVIELEKRLELLSMQINRLILKEDYSRHSISLSKTHQRKDITKYEFEGKIYNKRRLALECVKKYIENNNINSYDDVLKVFPDYIQGSIGVIKPVIIAEKYANAERRFFFADCDIVYIDGAPYVICSQWENKNIGRLLNVAQKIGYSIIPIHY